MAVQFTYKLLLSFLLLFALFPAANAYDIVVAQDGSGDYTTVQAAINAAPAGSVVPYTIFIKNGKYREKISVSATKTFLQLVGESVANTILYYDDPATVLGTEKSASFTVSANDFSAMNITFANTFGDGSQAVAITINADRAAFKNCRFMGNQDTIYTKGANGPRDYFTHCYIDGNIDFIFGSAIAIFDSCVIYAKARVTAGSSYITAANTPAGQTYGYLFKDCRFPANTGGTVYYLGRPWQNSASATLPLANNNTVYLNGTFGNNLVNPAGWSTWDAGTNTSLINYAEYKSKTFNGSLLDVSTRVPWSKQLTDVEASTYTMANMFGAWDPCSIYPGFCTGGGTDIAVSNFRAAKITAGSSQLNWNISWPMTGIVYTLYRSSDNVSFTQVYQTTALNDTSVNFSFNDAIPASGTKFYYYLDASLAGFASQKTDTVNVSSKQTIYSSVTALGLFTQGLGVPSSVQSFTLSAENLTGNLALDVPANFEISNDGGATWYSGTNLSLSPVNGSIAANTISVRLNAAAAGTYGGNITLSSVNASDVNIALTGNTVLAYTIPVSLINWPMTVNNTDSTAGRSTAVAATVPSFSNMVLSNGIQVPAVPAYSNMYGQAFNSGLAGSGLWSAAGNGGNGSTLNRAYYEEFTIKPVTDSSIIVDSFVTNFDFYGAASTTGNLGFKIAVSWSKSGFGSTGSATDSVDVLKYDSSGAGGASLSGYYTGGFNSGIPVFTKSDPAGPVSRFAFLLGSELSTPGVAVNAGESLTIRLYFSCGSGSPGRYATLKNVAAKGTVVSSTVPLRLISFTGGYDNNAVNLNWRTENEPGIKNYVVERSTDGRNFKTIGNQYAQNATGEGRYNFYDRSLIDGAAYYRLRIVSLDNSIKYSAVLKISRNGALHLSISPNPVRDELFITYPKEAAITAVYIRSADGKTVMKQDLPSGSVTSMVNLQNLPAGIYTVTYHNARTVLTAKFIKN